MAAGEHAGTYRRRLGRDRATQNTGRRALQHHSLVPRSARQLPLALAAAQGGKQVLAAVRALPGLTRRRRYRSTGPRCWPRPAVSPKKPRAGEGSGWRVTIRIPASIGDEAVVMWRALGLVVLPNYDDAAPAVTHHLAGYMPAKRCRTRAGHGGSISRTVFPTVLGGDGGHGEEHGRAVPRPRGDPDGSPGSRATPTWPRRTSWPPRARLWSGASGESIEFLLPCAGFCLSPSPRTRHQRGSWLSSRGGPANQHGRPRLRCGRPRLAALNQNLPPDG